MRQNSYDDDIKINIHREETDDLKIEVQKENVMEEDAFRKLLLFPDKQYIFDQFG